jgi:hypothetical protein
MKVAINTCFGGFSLSPRAVKRLAELNGRKCYFFTYQREPKMDFDVLIPRTLEEIEADNDRLRMWSAFDIPNPREVIGAPVRDADGLFKSYNERYEKHSLENGRAIDRSDPKLIQVIEELGGEHRKGASGQCAELSIVEIPDGTDYEIEEYDGNEHIAEKHRTWR